VSERLGVPVLDPALLAVRSAETLTAARAGTR
jgi:Asp/Glu/hydantoin racemase